MVLLGKAGGGFGVDGLEMAAKAGINTTKEIPAEPIGSRPYISH